MATIGSSELLAKIDLVTIDANTAAQGDQAFSFIGAGEFDGTAGQLRFSDGICQGDTNGDAVVDLELEVLGLSTMQTGDFLL